MSQRNRDQLILQPTEGVQSEVGRWLWALDDERQRTLTQLSDLPPAAVDWKPEWALHAVGTLLYHIALVEFDWLCVEVLEHSEDQTYPDEMVALFPYPMRTEGKLTPIIGIGMAEHLERLARTRRELLDVYGAMTLEDFRRARRFPNYDVTPEWVLHHLCQHEAEHRAEIAALRTQFNLQSEK